MYLRWQRLRAQEPYWWEQLRYMLAKLCEVVAATSPDAKGNNYTYRKAGNAAMDALDFIPTSWIQGVRAVRLPVGASARPRTNVVRGMSAADASGFLGEFA